MKLVLTIILAFYLSCGGGNQPSLSSNAPSTITSGGVQIISPVSVPRTALDAIDAGISIQLQKSSAAHPDWLQFNQLSAYRVQFTAPQAYSEIDDPGAPTLIRNGVKVAGTCDFNPPTIILPYQANWDYLDWLTQSARNESEHIRLYGNDQVLFQYYQGVNDVHPIFP